MNDDDRTTRGGSRFTKTVFIVGTALVGIGILGTLYALIADTRGAKIAREGAASVVAAEGESTFSIGTMRFSPTDDSATVYASDVTLAWQGGDEAFADEIRQKKDELARIAGDFFASCTKEKLSPAYLGSTKAELRALLGSSLTLGALSAVYLPDIAAH